MLGERKVLEISHLFMSYNCIFYCYFFCQVQFDAFFLINGDDVIEIFQSLYSVVRTKICCLLFTVFLHVAQSRGLGS